MQAMAQKKVPTPDFEKSLRELEKLVEQMEQGDLSLEASLEHFEKGVQLSRTCQQALREAEQKVEILMQKNGEDAQRDLAPFEREDT